MQNQRENLSDRLLNFAASIVRLTLLLSKTVAGRHIGQKPQPIILQFAFCNPKSERATSNRFYPRTPTGPDYRSKIVLEPNSSRPRGRRAPARPPWWRT